MNRKDPIHLLIADPSENSAEELVSELRNAGHATRAQHVVSVEQLDGVLDGQRWDMMLCRRSNDAEYSPEELISRLRQQELDCAMILIEDSDDPARLTEGLRAGATDVILDGQDERFLLVVQRELQNVAERRKRRQAELAMKESERRNQLLLDTSRAAIAYVHDGMHIYVNGAYVELFGYDNEDDLAAIPLLDMIGEEHQATFKQKLKEFAADAAAEPFTISGVRQDGGTFAATMILSVAAFDGEPCMQVLIRRAEVSTNTAELQQLRTQDPTTGLLNRPFFLDRLDQIVDDARREKHSGGLMMLQIDDFPRVREEAGLTGADSVIRMLAEVLDAETPDGVTLARLGDDTFGVVCVDRGRDDLMALAERYRSVVDDHLFSVGEQNVGVTLSVGVTLIGSRSESAQEALTQASRACTHVRDRDKHGNGVYLFDPVDFMTERRSGDSGDERSREVLHLLSEGIKNNTLVLLYQPIISLRGEEREHYEVYLRLPDENGNLLGPNEFIHLAEQSGMGGRLDRWVVLQSIRRLAARRSEGRDTRLTINLTYNALTDDSFLPWLKVALKAAKLPREAVVLQFTEIAATTYLKQAKAFSEALSNLECLVGLSRFGGSVNPFGTLRHLQVVYVKIDGALVNDLNEDEAGRSKFREMIRKLEDDGQLPVVPMVADAQLLAHLFQAGVNYVQGHYFAEPAPEMDFEFQSDI